ncbi:MAG: PDZ domain-containing protein, partial [Steroidobacteraceae bacterium]
MKSPTPKAAAPRLRQLLLATLLVAAVIALGGSGAQRAVAVAPEITSSGDLAANERHRRVMRLVSEVVDRQHYRQAALDDDMSSQIFERYLEALDGGRTYLLASDIAEFEHLRYQIDNAIRNADASPAFEIFTRYRQRNRDVLKHAIALLDQEPDFTIDESLRFDRSGEGWPASQQELQELWRKRVKNDALSLLLAGKTWPEASDILRKRYARVEKRIEQITADDVFETFMNAYSHVYDPHSNYLSPRNSDEYNIAMSLSYEGIGASLQLVDDHVTIMNVLPGGPAAASAQLKAGDRITAVGQGMDGPLTDVVGWRLDDVVQLIRGPIKTVVRLQILPDGSNPGAKESVLALTRNKVTLEGQAAQKQVHKIQRDGREFKIGVIEVPSFYQDF